MTGAGGEGMVVKPMTPIARGSKGLVQPALFIGRKGLCSHVIRFAYHMALDDFADHRFRLHAHELVHHAAVLEDLDGRQAANPVLRRKLLLLIGIHLGEHEVTLILLDQLGQHRHQHLARPAPGGPEVD